MKEYTEALQKFLIKNGPLQKWYETNPEECEQAWIEHLAHEMLDPLVTIEEILNGEKVDSVLEDFVISLFISNQMEEFKRNYEMLPDKSQFIDYIEDHDFKQQMTEYLLYGS